MEKFNQYSQSVVLRFESLASPSQSRHINR